MDEPIIEKSIRLPYGYAFTARARPSAVKTTILHLLPWAVYVAIPAGGRMKRIAYWAANRFSPLIKGQ